VVVQVLIVTISDDLHALSVQAALRARSVQCNIVESDRLSGEEALSLTINCRGLSNARVRTSEGTLLEIAACGVIWWRRPKALQQIDASALSEHQMGLINNDCTATLIGMLEGSFGGKWISSPRATEFASNKINQLAAAHKCGFRVPDTLISQFPEEVSQFNDRHNGRIIIKPVAGTPGPLLFTQFIRQEHLAATESIKACPTIYQEFIPGTRHIRLNCFGQKSFAGLIESENLDWRPNLNVPITRWTVPDKLHKQIRQVLDLLGLEMGIVDLKESSQGELVWLEVNPQGQFLFLEGLTREPLTELFADFLCESLNNCGIKLERNAY